MFKKVFTISLLCFTLLLLSSCTDKKVIKLYNWGEYLDQGLKDKFNAKYASKKIVLKEIKFDSNENALAAIRSGNQYDLIIPSEYCIDELVNLKLFGQPYLQKLDWSKTGIARSDLDPVLVSILEKFKAKKGYDILDYSIPYFWGNFGILYNKCKITSDEIARLGFKILKEKTSSKGPINVALYDSATDLFSSALKDLGLGIAEAKMKDINAASKWLDEIPKSNRNYITDEIFDEMVRGSYDVALAYSGDAAEIIARCNEINNKDIDLDYFIPTSGSNVWFDGIVMTSNAIPEAYEFIKFMYEQENNYTNADECGFASVLERVLDNQINDEEADEKIVQILKDLRTNSDKNELQIYQSNIKREIKLKWTVFRCK